MVVLPAPLWPSNAQTEPLATEKLTSRNAGAPPRDFETRFNAIAGSTIDGLFHGSS